MLVYTVEPLYISYNQELIAADFYQPIGLKNLPVIIMAPEFACLRHFRLMNYAQRFAAEGYAVVLFDYRYWGGSTGKPRELISLKSQIEDWKVVLQHILTLKQIDHRRIVLWGTGLSGGYVLDFGRELKNICAVIAQTPFLDGNEIAKQYPIHWLPKALKLSSQDYMSSKMGLKAKSLDVASETRLAFFPGKFAQQGYLSVLNPDYYWSGQVPARALFQLIRYRPIQHLDRIRVPVLFIAAKNDEMIHIELSRQAATNIASYVDYHEWEMHHFDIYNGKHFEKAIKIQLEFLHQHIGVTSP